MRLGATARWLRLVSPFSRAVLPSVALFFMLSVEDATSLVEDAAVR